MKQEEQIVEQILNATSHEPQRVLHELQFRSKLNELIFFFKPECFPLEKVEGIRKTLEMTFSKFNEYDVVLSGVVMFTGEQLDKIGIMSRHYGFINRLSNQASQIITDQELNAIGNRIGIADWRQYRILGGHEFLNAVAGFDEYSLLELWLKKESVKIRSGFYVQKFSLEGENIVLVNGFHPAQLRHFTNPSHRIVVLLLHSDSDWSMLRDDLTGDTFPQRAGRGSIRGELFKNGAEYGIYGVSVTRNCVHMSAGPFEALFEACNFLGSVSGSGFELEKTNMYRLMKEFGISDKCTVAATQNPTAIVDGERRDLFSFTENKNSPDAAADYLEHFVGRELMEGHE